MSTNNSTTGTSATTITNLLDLSSFWKQNEIKVNENGNLYVLVLRMSSMKVILRELNPKMYGNSDILQRYCKNMTCEELEEFNLFGYELNPIENIIDLRAEDENLFVFDKLNNLSDLDKFLFLSEKYMINSSEVYSDMNLNVWLYTMILNTRQSLIKYEDVISGKKDLFVHKQIYPKFYENNIPEYKMMLGKLYDTLIKVIIVRKNAQLTTPNEIVANIVRITGAANAWNINEEITSTYFDYYVISDDTIMKVDYAVFKAAGYVHNYMSGKTLVGLAFKNETGRGNGANYINLSGIINYNLTQYLKYTKCFDISQGIAENKIMNIVISIISVINGGDIMLKLRNLRLNMKEIQHYYNTHFKHLENTTSAVKNMLIPKNISTSNTDISIDKSNKNTAKSIDSDSEDDTNDTNEDTNIGEYHTRYGNTKATISTISTNTSKTTTEINKTNQISTLVWENKPNIEKIKPFVLTTDLFNDLPDKNIYSIDEFNQLVCFLDNVKLQNTFIGLKKKVFALLMVDYSNYHLIFNNRDAFKYVFDLLNQQLNGRFEFKLPQTEAAKMRLYMRIAMRYAFNEEIVSLKLGITSERILFDNENVHGEVSICSSKNGNYYRIFGHERFSYNPFHVNYIGQCSGMTSPALIVGKRGLYTNTEFVTRFDYMTDNLLVGLNYQNIVVTGSVVSACQIINPLEAKCKTLDEYLELYYPSRKHLNLFIPIKNMDDEESIKHNEQSSTYLEQNKLDLTDVDIAIDLVGILIEKNILPEEYYNGHENDIIKYLIDHNIVKLPTNELENEKNTENTESIACSSNSIETVEDNTNTDKVFSLSDIKAYVFNHFEYLVLEKIQYICRHIIQNAQKASTTLYNPPVIQKIMGVKLYRYRLNGFNRDFEFFPLMGIQQSIGTFHFSPVRAWFDGQSVKMLPSFVATAFTGMVYNPSIVINKNKNVAEIIFKYYQRGYGFAITNEEKEYIKQYYFSSEKWNPNCGNTILGKNKKCLEDILGWPDVNSIVTNAKTGLVGILYGLGSRIVNTTTKLNAFDENYQTHVYDTLKHEYYETICADNMFSINI